MQRSGSSEYLAIAKMNQIDRFLMGRLNIEPNPNAMNTATVLNLNDIENALSVLTATLFWIGKCIYFGRITL
jgi:hypothetical protein